MTSLSLDALNALAPDDFTAAFGDIAEHSPWVAEEAGKARPFADRAAAIRAFQHAVLGAGEERQLDLLRAHPDLAGRAARQGAVADESKREQEGAGLDTLTDAEFERFHRLNDTYRARFGFPFIFAVTGASKHQILDAFENRVGGTMAEECLTAIAQILRIVRFRLESRVTHEGATRP